MSDIGGLVERLVNLGVPVGEASDVVAKAFAAGAASAPARRKPAKGVQMTIETVLPPDPPRRATRLPADFVCDLAYAKQQGIPDGIAKREAEKFRNYWGARSGAGATKLDWPATWRNWCLRVAERGGYSPPAGGGHGPSGPSGPAGAAVDPRKMTREEWRPILAIYEKTSNWNPQYGPEPGLPGSFAPQRAML